MHWGRRRRAAGVVTVVLVALAIVAARHDPPPAADAAPLVTTTTVAPTTTTTPAATTAPTTTTTAVPEPGPEPQAVEFVAPPPPPPPNPGLPVFPNIVAMARNPSTPVYDAPFGRVIHTLQSPLRFSNGTLSFRVLDDVGRGWLHVGLAMRPNESTGYIRTADVDISTHNWSIDVDIAAHWITVYQGNTVFLSASVANGVSYTPTPVGNFFTTEGVWESYRYGAHGSYIFGLSAHSNVLMSFDGGDGQIGIHGTNAPWLLGTAASNGCIRLADANIVTLAKVIPVGTPVRIHAG